MADDNPNKFAKLRRGTRLGRVITDVPKHQQSFGGFISLLRGQNLVPADIDASFEDPEDTDKPFAPHYEQYVRPHVQGFEQKRIEALQKLRKRALIVIPIFILILVVVIAVLVKVGNVNSLLFWIAFAIIAASIVWCYMPISQFKSAVKEEIFPNIFSFFGEEFQYSENGQLSIKSLKPSGIIPSYRKEYIDDYIKGSYQGVTLELTEAKLTSSSGSGESEKTRTVFKGLIILLSMNKKFSGKTVVQRDAGKLFNWVTNKVGSMEKVALEDPVFEKKFEVYSTDQVEARYLLTTSFMERLLELSALFGDLGVQCSFYDDKLLLMIASPKNHFETASIFQPATFTDDINTVLNEMRMIFQIIDILKLHQRTGL